MKLSLRDNFCSSPWFHIRINPAGYYLPCRWDLSKFTSDYHVQTTSIKDYMNSQQMRDFRLELLDGRPSEICQSCYYQDSSGKLSGRLKQLLKSAVNVENFDKTFCNSPHWDLFEHSYHNQGHTDYTPVDLQIDLGNTCNGACIMCIPTYSSRLAQDYKKLHSFSSEVFPKFETVENWADDPVLVEKFVDEIAQLPNIKYIHFLGGETLYLKSFYDICNRLIERGISKNISIGTTTNGSLYTDNLDYIIDNFKHVHLGVSIETATPLNDYIRWPSQIDQVLEHLGKFLTKRESGNLHVSLRITPNVFSVYHLDSIIEYMLTHQVTAESCDILRKPEWLRIELLPESLRRQTLKKINRVIDKFGIIPTNSNIVNLRSEALVDEVIRKVVYEYRDFLETYQPPANIDHLRTNMVQLIKGFESLRGNNILDYLPEYEEFLRSHGY